MDWRHVGELVKAGHVVVRAMLNLIVWVKTNAGQGSFYRSQHELIGAFRVGSASHLNTIELGRHGRNRSNVWKYAGANTFRKGRLDDLRGHPTVKPVAWSPTPSKTAPVVARSSSTHSAGRARPYWRPSG